MRHDAVGDIVDALLVHIPFVPWSAAERMRAMLRIEAFATADVIAASGPALMCDHEVLHLLVDTPYSEFSPGFFYTNGAAYFYSKDSGLYSPYVAGGMPVYQPQAGKYYYIDYASGVFYLCANQNHGS